MHEILPGVYHWATFHERIKHTVSSYYAAHEGEAVLIDPRMPDEGPGWFRDRVVPRDIILTNRHHYRHSDQFEREFGCTVWCHSAGLHEFTAGQRIAPYEFGHTFACGIEALEVACICPDEAALYLPWAGAIAFADGLVRMPYDGELAFVPDMLLGDDPAAVKTGLLQAFERLLERDFDSILLAHGAPLVSGAKAALSAFIASGGAAQGPGGRAHPTR